MSAEEGRRLRDEGIARLRPPAQEWREVVTEVADEHLNNHGWVCSNIPRELVGMPYDDEGNDCHPNAFSAWWRSYKSERKLVPYGLDSSSPVASQHGRTVLKWRRP